MYLTSAVTEGHSYGELVTKITAETIDREEALLIHDIISSNPRKRRPYFGITLNGDMRIEKVIFNNPATIVLWADGTKTVVKRQKGDRYDKEKGLAMCIAKKALGNKGNFNNVFKEWL